MRIIACDDQALAFADPRVEAFLRYRLSPGGTAAVIEDGGYTALLPALAKAGASKLDSHRVRKLPVQHELTPAMMMLTSDVVNLREDSSKALRYELVYRASKDDEWFFYP